MMPEELQRAVDSLTQNADTKTLKAARESVSADYRKGTDSHAAFRDPAKLLSYLVTRLPATYGAALQVFLEVRARLPNFPIRASIDLGAGPGSASWAALEVFPELSKLVLVEKERDAMELGKKLSSASIHPAWKQAEWQQESLESLKVPLVDLAILSYVVAELPSGIVLIERLLEREIPLIAVIEPGTPKGFERILAIRAFALQKGMQIAAPCPHFLACPMAGGDWCHFAARIERTRLHRQLKEGSLGYEDEKYSYVVLTHPKITLSQIEGRVVCPPQKASGHVRLPLCAASGNLQEIVISRKDKAKYRQARDAEWGSAWIQM